MLLGLSDKNLKIRIQMEVIKNSLLRGHTSEFLYLGYYQRWGQEEG